MDTKKKSWLWSSGGASYDSDYQAWLTHVITTDGGTDFSSTVKNAQNALVVALKAGGYWTRIKWFYFLHCGDTTVGRRNVKSPSTLRTTLSGTNTFLEGSGTKSDGSSYINTGYPANAYAGIETDITTFNYIPTSSTTGTDQATHGTRVAGAGDIWFMYPRASGTNVLSRRHYLAASVSAVNANHKGFYAHTYDGTNDVVYKDGVKTSNAATPVAPTIASPLLLLARNTNGVGGVTAADFYTTGYLSYFMALNRINDADESAIRALLTTYNTACSIP